jgi:putative colanic acid biosynthesis UDP-glucose lipid carrier transferase
MICWWESDFFFTKQVWLMLNLSFFVVIYFFSNIHERRVIYADQLLLQVIKIILLHAVVFLALISFLDANDTSWKVIAKFYGLFFICLSVWWIGSRKLLRWYRTKGFNFKRIIIIGGGTVGIRLMDELESDQGYGYRILGFFDNNRKAKTVKGYKGDLENVEQFVKDNLIDEMYCAIPDTDNDDVLQMIKIAENNAVDFYYVPQFGRRITRRFELSSIGNVPILSIRPNPLSNTLNRLAKRLFDFVVSTIALIISPIILIPVAIGIKMTSPGPVFFKQKRTGYRGETFTCYKFRTMKVNKDSDKVQASKDDPRKTAFGNFLRSTSIDELPQFYNVWKGEMSIVGPRPHMTKHTEIYSSLIDKYMLRHTIKPGITGWAQVNGYRGQTDQLWKMEKRVEFDVWYAENWNFMLDIKIIFLTVIHMFGGEKNAF